MNFVAAILTVAAVSLTCSVRPASAHGYLANPVSRNYLHNTDYCPQCLNAGGTFGWIQMRWLCSANGPNKTPP